MDFLEFVAHSEWPLVAGAGLWLTRKALERMLDRVSPTKLDAWGFKAEFEKALDKVELLAPALTGKLEITGDAATLDATGDTSTPPTRREAETPTEKLTYNNSPDLVILQAWRRLEGSMRKMSDMQGHNSSRRIEQAARELGLDADGISALMELRKLRNQVAHSVDAPVTEAEAMRFEAATERLSMQMVNGPKKPDVPKEDL